MMFTMDSKLIALIVILMALVVEGKPDQEKPESSIREYIIRLQEHGEKHTQKGEFAQKMKVIYGMEVEEYFVGQNSPALHYALVNVTDDQVEEIRLMPEVLYFEQNSEVSVCGKTNTIKCNRHDASGRGQWGLDRIDQREDLYSIDMKQKYTFGTHDEGVGVDVYAIDTGIDVDHFELTGHASWGYVAPGLGGEVDTNGHGTHVAGIITSASYGVTKRAHVIAVKVLTGASSGKVSDILLGIDWVLNHHAAKVDKKSVVNLSVYVLRSISLDDGVTALLNAGMTVVAAAGSNRDDACNFSPGGVSGVLTVAATDRYDDADEDNNWGACVNLFAPGVEIRSHIPGGTNAMKSGTSMAAAFVSGIIARHMSDIDFKPSAGYKNWVINRSTQGAILNLVNSSQEATPNKLAYIACSEVPGTGGTARNFPSIIAAVFLFILLLEHFLN